MSAFQKPTFTSEYWNLGPHLDQQPESWQQLMNRRINLEIQLERVEGSGSGDGADAGCGALTGAGAGAGAGSCAGA
eukprot:10835903-Karenia_brevis.AAC.1